MNHVTKKKRRRIFVRNTFKLEYIRSTSPHVHINYILTAITVSEWHLWRERTMFDNSKGAIQRRHEREREKSKKQRRKTQCDFPSLPSFPPSCSQTKALLKEEGEDAWVRNRTTYFLPEERKKEMRTCFPTINIFILMRERERGRRRRKCKECFDVRVRWMYVLEWLIIE